MVSSQDLAEVYQIYIYTLCTLLFRLTFVKSILIFPILYIAATATRESTFKFEIVCALGIIEARVEGPKRPQDPVCDLETGYVDVFTDLKVSGSAPRTIEH